MKSTPFRIGASIALGAILSSGTVLVAAGHHPGSRANDTAMLHPSDNDALVNMSDAVAGESLANLGSLDDAMVSGKLPLVYVTVTDVSPTAALTTLDVKPERLVWAPDGATFDPTSFTAWAEGLPTGDREVLANLQLPFSAVLATADNDEILALMPFTTDGAAVDTQSADGVLFLQGAAQALWDQGSLSISSTGFSCDPQQVISFGRDPVSNIRAYLEGFGQLPGNARSQMSKGIDRAADALEQEAPRRHDPVTGDNVPVDSNRIAAQLRTGVPARAVQVAYTVPVSVDLAGVSDSPATKAVVFVDHGSARVLGWIPATYVQSDDNQGIADSTISTFIGIPDKGDKVDVYLRSLQGSFDCAPTAAEVPLLSISYGDFAGNKRAVVHIAARKTTVAGAAQ